MRVPGLIEGPESFEQILRLQLAQIGVRVYARIHVQSKGLNDTHHGGYFIVIYI